MKNIMLISLALITPSLVWAAAPAPVGKNVERRIMVQNIEDRSASSGKPGCDFYSFWSSPGGAVRELIEDELSSRGGITVLEREHLNDLSAELNNENLDESTKVAKKKFIAANLAIAGVISEFDWCVSGGGQSLNVGGLLGIGDLSVGHRKTSAHVAIQLRLIDVATGKILKTVRSSGSVDGGGFSLDADVAGLSFNQDTFAETPLGQANTIAVKKAVSELMASLR